MDIEEGAWKEETCVGRHRSRCVGVGTGGSMKFEAHEDWEVDGSYGVIENVEEEELCRRWRSS
jgi:hypothetical protein